MIKMKYSDKGDIGKGSKFIVVGTSRKGVRKVLIAPFRKRTTAKKHLKIHEPYFKKTGFKRLTVVLNPKYKSRK